MKIRELVGFGVLPVVLLLLAWAINAMRLWDSTANMTLPWMLSAVAIAVLLLGVVCLVSGRGPGELPWVVSATTVVVVMVLFGLGLLVDANTYLQSRQDFGMYSNHSTIDLMACLGGWMGFGVILSGVFALAWAGGRRAKKDGE